MIIDFYGQGGGSGSGVTPEEVQEQIQSALTEYTPTSGFSTINGSAITEGEAIVIDEPDLTNYWDSAQTESAISAATSGKADKPLRETYPLAVSTLRINAGNYDLVLNGDYGQNIGNIWAPLNNGHAGQILVARGGQISPVWSAVTFISSADVQSQIDTKAADYTPTTGFSTINGSAITNGGNIVIEGGGDLSNYWDSAQTQAHIDSAYTSAITHIEDVERVTAAALNELHSEVDAISGASENYITSAYVNTALASYTPTSGFSTINGSAITNGDNLVIDADLSGYWDSAETQTAITTATSGLATSAQVYTVEYTVSVALNELHTEMSAITAASENFVTSAQVETQITSKGYATSANVNTALASYTPTSGFSTINGSAITAGGNLVIEGGGDLSAYWTSAQTQTAITTATANMVSSTTVTNIWRGTQAQYDLIDPKDPNALYIILAS